MRIIRWGVLMLPVVFAAQLAFAQAPMAKGMASYHPFEVAGTYSHVLTDGSLGGFALNGFTASASVNIISLAQATAEVGRYYGKGVTLTSFLAGPQANFQIYRFRPFIRGLFGISHTTIASSNEGNAFTI